MIAGLHGFKPSDETEKAMALRARLDRQLASIRASGNLSEQGKRQRMATAVLAAREQLAGLRDAEAARSTARRAHLERQLFGTTSGNAMDAVNARDAMDRAERCTKPTEALQLLDRCTRTGDEALARALAHRAAEAGMGWEQILDRYAAGRPAAADALGELRQLDTDRADRTQALGRSAVYSVSAPPELARVMAHQLPAVAAATDPDEDNATSGQGTGAGNAAVRGMFGDTH